MPANSSVHGLDAATPNTKKLRVRVVRGVELAKKDIFGASDPYVAVSLLQGETLIDKVQTTTIKKSLNPVWNQEFVFRVDPSNCRVLLEVFDENRITRDDFLGSVECDLVHMHVPTERLGRPIRERDLILRPRTHRSRVRGQLRLALSYLNEGQVDEENDSSTSANQSWETLPTSSELAAQASRRSTTATEEAPAPVNRTTSLTAPENPLPSGWEERTDNNGRIFYVNHVDRTTQWHRPPPDATNTPENRTYERQNSSQIWQRQRDDFRERWETNQTAAPVAGAANTGQHLNTEVEALSNALSASYARGSQQNSSFMSSHSPEHQDTSEEVAQWIEDDGEGDMPAGWEMQVAPTGRKFFINHADRTTTWRDPRTGKLTTVPAKKPASGSKHQVDDIGPLPPGWEERKHTDGRIFFINHSLRTTQWEDPRFYNQSIAGPAVPYSRDYKRKFEYFRSHLVRPPGPAPGQPGAGKQKFDIHVRRDNILNDSFRAIMAVPSDKVDVLKYHLWIDFDGETGLDYGGVAREWFFQLSHEIFNPYYGLFEYSAVDNYTLQINPNSGVCNEDHLSYFKFVGRVMGIALFHGKMLDAFFIRPFYKMMLGKAITLSDMESVDSEYYNSLIWIADNDPTELDLKFEVDEEVFGSMQTRELKPGGADISVNDDNKQEYIDLIIRYRFVSRVNDQMSHIMAGVRELIPDSLMQIFDANELELLLCGLQKIDVKDWKDHTNYKGGYGPNHPVIQNFWKCILTFDNETRSRLLQFVTGTSRVPMNGFRELYGSSGLQWFTIEKWGAPDMLPRAHTCFNRIDLPPYQSYHDLREKLVCAIENAEIFAGVD